MLTGAASVVTRACAEISKRQLPLCQPPAQMSRSGHRAKAEDALGGWLAANPQDAEALQHLGAVQKGLGRLGDAIETYSLGLKQDPNRALLRNMRGWAYVDQEK